MMNKTNLLIEFILFLIRICTIMSAYMLMRCLGLNNEAGEYNRSKEKWWDKRDKKRIQREYRERIRTAPCLAFLHSCLPSTTAVCVYVMKYMTGTCTPLGPQSVQVGLWLAPPTRDTNSLRHSPQAGGCSPPGPKPHTMRAASSPLQLTSSTRPETPILHFLMWRPAHYFCCWFSTAVLNSFCIFF